MPTAIKLSTLALFLFIVGCAQIKPLPQTPSKKPHIVENNYTKNEQKIVYVGQEIVKVKDYYSIESSKPYVMASNDWTINSPLAFKIHGNKGKKAPIFGTAIVDEKTYYTILMYQTPCFIELIDDDGIFNETMLSSMGCREKNLWTWKIEPESTRFNIYNDTSIDKSSGFMNYELLYGGTNGDSFSVTYREYTPDNLAKPAFYQDLTFSNSSQHIRYKNLKIKVHAVNNEEITYTVVED